MINFKQFLEESRSAPLYHSAPIEFLESIYSKGLLPKTLHSTGKIGGNKNHEVVWYVAGEPEIEKYAKGVSLTRDFKFAKNWQGNYSVIFEIDHRRLAQRYKIIPFQYFQARGFARSSDSKRNESEEFVLTTKPIPMSFISRIYVNSNFQNSDEIKKIQQERGSSFIVTY